MASHPKRRKLDRQATQGAPPSAQTRLLTTIGASGLRRWEQTVSQRFSSSSLSEQSACVLCSYISSSSVADSPLSVTSTVSE